MQHANNRGETKMASQWVRSNDVVWEELDGEAVLVSTTKQKTWALNAAASVIWKCCDGQISIEEIARRVAAACGREVGSVKREILEFCRELERKGLISISTMNLKTLSNQSLVANLSVAGFSLPPKIIMESSSLGIRGRPSPRGFCNP